MNFLEKAAGKSAGSTAGPQIPPPDLLYEFWVGTTPIQNMSRMVEFYQNNVHLQSELKASPWEFQQTMKLEEWANTVGITEESHATPTMGDYRCVHTD